MTVVAVSSHPDDVAFSCGGVVARAAAGGLVVVVTIFDGDLVGPPPPFAVELAARAGGMPDPARRRSEDDAAVAALGATALRLGIPDCVFRRDRAGRPRVASDGDLFSAPGADDEHVTAAASAALEQVLDRHAPDVVLAPLALGGHLDHRIGRRATEAAVDGRAVGIAYYEDLPYAAWQPEPDRALTVGLAPVVVDVADTWDRKIAAAGAYASQLGLVWPPPDDWEADLTAYARRIGDGAVVERLWCTEPAARALASVGSFAGAQDE